MPAMVTSFRCHKSIQESESKYEAVIWQHSLLECSMRLKTAPSPAQVKALYIILAEAQDFFARA
jgi:hypothetical protein